MVPYLLKQLSAKLILWAKFTNSTKFLIKNPANFLIALQSGILRLASPLTKQDIPDNSRAIHQFY
jgi:hypothetical protein